VTAIDILKRHGIRPSKGLGQNFLIDHSVFDRILGASELTKDDTVLEVGPGVGLLTRRLSEAAGRVVAVELDIKMIAVLGETLSGCDNVHIIQGDILEVDPVATVSEILPGDARGANLRYKVVANLPYYITSAVLRRLLSSRVRPELLCVMVQREVADRIRAKPGKSSLLSLSVQVYGEPELIAGVPARSFYPRPKVDSAVLRIRTHDRPLIREEQLASFFRVIRAGFGQKRKQLHNSLNALPFSHDAVLGALAEAGIAPERRAQTLTFDEWQRLVDALYTPG